MPSPDQAVEIFRTSFNCAQSVLGAFAGRFSLDPGTAARISTGFGGGMGRRQEVCGAVTGAVMVLGLAFGRAPDEDKNRQETTYAKTREFFAEFEKRHAAVNCRALLDGCELLTPRGQDRFKSEKMIDRCQDFVRSAAEILDLMLQEAP
jgi:C_GCAxxG_C_C family probable redox protein